MNARDVGLAVVGLGGGRRHADDAIDPSVGLTEMASVGTPIRAGEPLCIVHAASDVEADEADHGAACGIRIADEAPAARSIVMERIAP